MSDYETPWVDDHDPLCPCTFGPFVDAGYCECNLIARVRADELERVTATLEAQHASGVSAAVRSARADERERIAQAIEAKADDMHTEVGLTDYGGDKSWQRNADLSMCGGLRIAARIARDGGSPTV